MSAISSYLFGRKYEINVYLASGKKITVSSSELEPNALRVTFDTYAPGYGQSLWAADVSIYNLDSDTEHALIKESDTVVVSAGYYNGNYGKIFQGQVFQPMWERENNVDYKVTLRCLVGWNDLKQQIISYNHTALASQYELIAKMASSAHMKIGYLSDDLKDKTLPRGKVLFGAPEKYISQAAKDNNAQWWLGDDGLVVGKIDDRVVPEAIVYTPTTGIIGTPQQVQDGVNFRVLLDSRLKVQMPALQVKIDNSQIRQARRQIDVTGQSTAPLQTILDRDGVYIVGAVRHYGDTRGNEWYTEVTGYTSVNGKMSMLAGLENANPN